LALRWIALASVAFALAVASFLLLRRLAGALTEPLPPAALIATAGVALAWAWGVRIASTRWAADESGRFVSVWAPAIVLLVLAVACSYPGGRIIDWIVWLPAMVANWLLPRSHFHPARHSSPAIARSFPEPSLHGDEHVVQQLSRIRTADGHDVIRGTLLAEFEPDERTVTLYAAFCPPFERLPHVEATTPDAAAAAVKVAQVLHNGVRLEVRLAKPTNQQRGVTVELHATETSES
jgi:hypothetical protein